MRCINSCLTIAIASPSPPFSQLSSLLLATPGLSIPPPVTLVSPIFDSALYLLQGFKDKGLRDLTLRLRDSEFRKGGEMATKKAVGRIVHFANLPLKLLLPSSRENITEVAFKTIPSASKIEIKRVLESLYGLQVAKVNTLNMEGKKKRSKGSLAFYRRPDYKKAYVTLKEPVSLPANLFPLNMMEEEKAPEGKETNRRSKQ